MNSGQSIKSLMTRPLILGLILSLGFGLLGWRLFEMQIIEGAYYSELADRNRVSNVPLPAPRGLILDRKGRKLTTNNLQSSVFYIVSGDEATDSIAIGKLASFLDIPLEEAVKIQAIAKSSEAETVVPVKSDLPKSVIIELEERKDQFPRTIIENEAGRSYPYGRFTAHILGYIGLISQDQYEQRKHLGYAPTDVVGKYGIEDMYDSQLRGKAGAKKLLVDVTGKVQGVKMRPARDKNGEEVINDEGGAVMEEDRTYPQAGSDIQLTVDIDFQAAIQPLMRDRPGVVVLMDPDTGGVLSLVSSPGFDPNIFGGKVSSADWSMLINDPGKPLQDRAIQNAYPPGSTFKIATAWAILGNGKATAGSGVTCRGVFELGTGKFRCWNRGGHGWVDFVQAIAYSCDVFFYNYGYETGASGIADSARRLGLGSVSGIDLPGEVSGRIPDADWKLAKIGEPWYGGDTVNMAIGQGYIQATPLQMARLGATIANGGNLVTPHLIKIFDQGSPKPIGIEASQLDIIRSGMRGAVSFATGTAKVLSGLPFSVAAKTGTAQDPPRKDPHSWVVAYAPYEQPKIVLAVLLENVPEGEQTAVMLGKEILSLPVIEDYIMGIGN